MALLFSEQPGGNPYIPLFQEAGLLDLLTKVVDNVNIENDTLQAAERILNRWFGGEQDPQEPAQEPAAFGDNVVQHFDFSSC